jgi:hypothetical protein
MAGKINYYALGQQAQANSLKEGSLDNISSQICGTGIYNVPEKPEDREAFMAGIQNAENNPPNT